MLRGPNQGMPNGQAFFFLIALHESRFVRGPNL